MVKERLAETYDRISAVITPVLEREGFELVDLEYKRGPKRWMLRVMLDRLGRTRYRGSLKDEAEPGEGVRIDDCVRMSKLLSPLLDVEDLIPTAYTLEVSSAGVNRPLKSPRHFQIARGLQVRVKTRVPVAGESFFVAPLLEADDEQIVLDVRGREVPIPYRLVSHANIEFQF